MKRNIRFKNEEDVKNNLILPFFKALDFEESEISFETKLDLQLGRGPFTIESSAENKKRGYLDILFKRNEKPLFVVETKNPNDQITSKDAKQAISYARLLMAPFAVVTNAYETEIYDTVTGKEIQGQHLKNSTYVRNDYEVSISDAIKYEAQKAFVALSTNNLAKFCEIQKDYRMNHLKGFTKDTEKKYIPDTYVVRKEKNSIGEFIKSKNSCFVIVGESGCGKTNLACDVAAELGKEYPTLFLDGSRLSKPIEDELADDFNWELPAERTPIQIIKRVESILSTNGKPLILVIDAVDEWTISNAHKELDRFVGRIKDKKIKLILTCKDSEIDRFQRISGTPSETSMTTFKPQELEKANYSYLLKRFTDEEVNEAIEKYRCIFNVEGDIVGRTKEECKLGFTLRVLFEVFKETAEDIPQKFTSRQLLERFIDEKLAKIANREVAENFLKDIAKLLYEENQIEIEVDSAREKLGLTPTEVISEELFSHYLLQRTQTQTGPKVRFYFDKVREYLVAYRILKLQEVGDGELRQKIEELNGNKVGWYALLFFADAEGEKYQVKIGKYLAEKGKTLDFVAFVTERNLISVFNEEVSEISKDPQALFYLIQHFPMKIENLKEVDYLLERTLETEKIPTIIDRIFKNSLSEENSEYIIQFWDKNFEKMAHLDLAPYSLSIFTTII